MLSHVADCCLPACHLSLHRSVATEMKSSCNTLTIRTPSGGGYTAAMRSMRRTVAEWRAGSVRRVARILCTWLVSATVAIVVAHIRGNYFAVIHPALAKVVWMPPHIDQAGSVPMMSAFPEWSVVGKVHDCLFRMLSIRSTHPSNIHLALLSVCTFCLRLHVQVHVTMQPQTYD